MAKIDYYSKEEEYNEIIQEKTQDEKEDEGLSNFRLTKEERETIIVYSDADNCWYADTSVVKHINKFKKQGWELIREQFYPDGVLMSAEFKGNAKAISIRDIKTDKPKRIMSEEHKQKLLEARFKTKE